MAAPRRAVADPRQACGAPAAVAGGQGPVVYGPDAPTEVAPGDRDALWQRMRPYLREPAVRAPGDFTDFHAGEFRDDQRRWLLVIEEFC